MFPGDCEEPWASKLQRGQSLKKANPQLGSTHPAGVCLL